MKTPLPDHQLSAGQTTGVISDDTTAPLPDDGSRLTAACIRLAHQQER